MIAATDHEFPALIRTGDLESAPDAELFALVDELKEREKGRNQLLDRLSIEEGEEIAAAARKACDAARAIYERIAAMKPTTAAGVVCQLELAADGWTAPINGADGHGRPSRDRAPRDRAPGDRAPAASPEGGEASTCAATTGIPGEPDIIEAAEPCGTPRSDQNPAASDRADLADRTRIPQTEPPIPKRRPHAR